jgi:hypothetical protein
LRCFDPLDERGDGSAGFDVDACVFGADWLVCDPDTLWLPSAAAGESELLEKMTCTVSRNNTSSATTEASTTRRRRQ